MVKLGPALASLASSRAVTGAAALIALDVAGTDGLAHAWSMLTGWLPHAVPPTAPHAAAPVRTAWWTPR